jgi:DsbC/DsbD-like thiol-disulfide interchange protein
MKRIFSLLFAILAFSLPAKADPYANAVKLEVLPGWRMPDGRHMAGLRLTLADGWKTYWRAPGDAGIPPIFDWRGSANLSTSEVFWPKPIVFSQNGMRSIGYKYDVILPVRLTPKREGQNIRLKGVVDIGICKDICVPRRMKIDVALPNATTRPVPSIAAAMAARPLSGDEAGLRSARCEIVPAEKGFDLTVTLRMPSAGGKEFAVIETGNPQIWVHEAATARRSGNLTITTSLVHVEGESFFLDRSAVRITVLGSKHSVDIRGCNSG